MTLNTRKAQADMKEHGTSYYTLKHFRFEEQWADSYSSDFKKFNVGELESYLLGFCDDEEKFVGRQDLVSVDAYLTIGVRKSLAYCNRDLAAEVNPLVLANNHPAHSMLTQMQDKCWKREKTISLVSMDYADYFEAHLSSIGSVMNERNFARFGWVGGILRVGPNIYRDSKKISTNKMSQEDKLAILLDLAWEAGKGRIKIDKVDHEKGDHHEETMAISFTIVSLGHNTTKKLKDPTTNTEVLLHMKQNVEKGDIGGIHTLRSECGALGHPFMGMEKPDPVLGYEEGAVITYKCEMGYIRIGNKRRTCGPNGLWTGSRPSCMSARELADLYLPLWAQILIGIGCLIIVCVLIPFIGRLLQKHVQTQAFRLVFADLDRSHKGTINKADLKQALAEMDEDNSGEVSFDQFLKVVNAPVGHSESRGGVCRCLGVCCCCLTCTSCRNVGYVEAPQTVSAA